MSDSVSINYSFQANPEPPSAPVSPRLYAFGGIETINLPMGQALLLNPNTGKRMAVTRDVAIALQFCGTFQTLDQHAASLVAAMPELGGNKADVVRVLEAVRDAGMFTPAADLCARLNADSEQRASAPARAFIITCDRPDALGRLLAGIKANGIAADIDRLTVVDNSRSADNRAENAELLAGFAPSADYDCDYFGLERQERLIEGLCERLPAHENQIRFLLDPQRWADHKSYGLSRTYCLLRSVGYRCVIIDDDATFALYSAPGSDASLHFDSTGRSMRPYADNDSALTATTRLPGDPVSGHLQCLGKNIVTSASLLGNEQITESQLEGFEAGQALQFTAASGVIVTESGTVGDHGARNNNWMLFLDPESAAALEAFPGGVDDALRTEATWVGKIRPTLSPRSNMSLVTGLDNSELLPPYFPVFRAEDQLFGWMTHYLHPQSCALQYNWAVPHLPLESRDRGFNFREYGFGLSLFCHFLRERAPKEGGDPATRIKLIADLLSGLAQASDEELLGLYRTQMLSYISESTTDLDTRMKALAPEQDTLKLLTEDALAELYAAINEIDSPASISELPAGSSDDELVRTAREYLKHFARALRAWPAIREAARSLD